MTDSFIGTKIETPKGGHLTVVGCIKTKGKVAMYECICDICNKDTELYPSNFFSQKANLINGFIPCGCAKKPRFDENQSKVLISRHCKNKNMNFDGFGDTGYHKSSRKTSLYISCNVCNNKNTVNMFSFLNHLSGCPSCAYKNRHKDCMADVLSICEDNGYEFVGYDRGYKNANSKFSYICKEHGIQKISRVKFVNGGQRCPSCAISGYKKNKPGIYYMYLWYNDDIKFIKHGITNNINNRLKDQTNASNNLKYEQILILNCFDGNIPVEIERIIQKQFDFGFVDKSIFPDGYTETTSIENMSDIKNMAIKLYEEMK